MAKLKENSQISKLKMEEDTSKRKTLITGFTQVCQKQGGGGQNYKSKQVRQQKMWELRGVKINHQHVDYGWFLKAFFA